MLKTTALAYVLTALFFCGLDAVWLGLIARGFYQDQIGPLMLAAPRWVPALAFYALYVAGIVFFCVRPAWRAAAWRRAGGAGAFLGAVAYATYDLTNLATLKGWSLPMALADILWGICATGTAAAAACWLGTRRHH